VEDNPETRESLRLLLSLSGHEVREAADGPEGLRLALEWRPDAVVCDIGLPRLDGWQVARRVRQALGPGVLLVALTGYGQDEDRRRSLGAGFDHHLNKPAEPRDLLALLSKAVAGPLDRGAAAAPRHGGVPAGVPVSPERRAYPRYRAGAGACLFHVLYARGEVLGRAVPKDVSAGGALLLSPRLGPPGAAVVLEALPPHPLAGRCLPFRGVRYRDLADGGYLLAGTFVPPLSDEEARALAGASLAGGVG
jgi:CheY-like chemotaxis protein